MSTATSIQVISGTLLSLQDQIITAADEVRRDGPAEVLHDYRVAVRKTGVLLAGLVDLFPAGELSGFRSGFALAMKKTGVVRDLQVSRIAFVRYQKSHDDPAGFGIGILLEYLDKVLQKRQEKLRLFLDSPAYLNTEQNWSQYLQHISNRKYTSGYLTCPAGLYARDAISRSYFNTARLGFAIDRKTRANAFHKTRKSCKHLRYLLEMFDEYLPAGSAKRIIRKLKRLQNNLGDIQDIEVRLGFAGRFLREMHGREAGNHRKAVERMIRSIKAERKPLASASRKIIRKFLIDFPAEYISDLSDWKHPDPLRYS